MDIWDVEGNAELIYRLAGGDPADPEGTAWLARKLLGPDCIRYRPHMMAKASLCRVDDRWRIYLRQGNHPREESFLIGHELAEWFYRDQQGEPDVEEACNRLGAALVAPRPAFASVLQNVTRSVPRIAGMFVSSHTLVALRIAETTGRPAAISSTHKVWIRGEPCAPIASEAQVRDTAARRVDGLAKSRIRDAKHRVLITPAA